MYLNTCTKQEVLEHFDLWLWERYDWLGFDQLNKIILKADTILSDKDDLDYYAIEGHRSLYNAIIGA
jgi:hypothetical protein